SACGENVISIGGSRFEEGENDPEANDDFRNAGRLTPSFHDSSNTAAYCRASSALLKLMTWFEFTYIPVTEKFVDPVSTLVAVDAAAPRFTTSTLSCENRPNLPRLIAAPVFAAAVKRASN